MMMMEEVLGSFAFERIVINLNSNISIDDVK